MATQAVYALDLVALMAGGRFQDIASLFIERMEAQAHPKTADSSLSAAALSPSEPRTALTEHAGIASKDIAQTPRNVLTGEGRSLQPCLKKARREGLAAAPYHARGVPSAVGVPRIRMPPLDVFQREFMETATPVILTGVSAVVMLSWFCRSSIHINEHLDFLCWLG